jgi:ATP-dependent DNA helicase RecG
LLADDPSDAALERLNLVARIQDGFTLAQEDMNRRGIGELMGPRQHGLTDSAMEALRSPELLDEVRDEVVLLSSADPGFEAHPVLRAAAMRRQEQMSIS